MIPSERKKTSNINKNWPPWTDRRREQRHGSPPLPSIPPRWWSHTSASCSGSKLRPSYHTGRSQTPGWSEVKKKSVQKNRLKSIIKCFLSGLCICIFVFSVLSFWYSWVVITPLPKFQTLWVICIEWAILRRFFRKKTFGNWFFIFEAYLQKKWLLWSF